MQYVHAKFVALVLAYNRHYPAWLGFPLTKPVIRHRPTSDCQRRVMMPSMSPRVFQQRERLVPAAATSHQRFLFVKRRVGINIRKGRCESAAPKTPIAVCQPMFDGNGEFEFGTAKRYSTILNLALALFEHPIPHLDPSLPSSRQLKLGPECCSLDLKALIVTGNAPIRILSSSPYDSTMCWMVMSAAPPTQLVEAERPALPQRYPSRSVEAARPTR